MTAKELKSKIKDNCQRMNIIVEKCEKEVRELTDSEQSEYNDLKSDTESCRAELRKLKDNLKSMKVETRGCGEDDSKKEEKSDDDSKDEDPKDEDKKPEETKSDSEDEPKDSEDDKDDMSDDDTKKDDSEDEPKDSEDDSDSDDDMKDDSDEDDTKENKENKNNNRSIVMKKEQKFSILRTIRSIVNNEKLNDIDAAVLADGKSEFRSAGLSVNGQIQLPTEEKRAIQVTGEEGEHDDVVATDILNVLGPLRAKNVLVQAGAKYLTNLVGDVKVPVMSAENAFWEGETSSAKDGAGKFTSVTLKPKRLTAYIDISKQFLAQDGVGAEAVIRQDLVNAINSKLEATILGDGAGSETQPAGLFNGANVATATDFKGVVDLEASLERTNVIGEIKYIASPEAKAAFRNMQKGSKGMTYLAYQDGELDGTPVLSTSNVAANKFLCGDFSNLAIGSWAGIDLTVDPYTKAADGQIRLVINAFFDAVVLRKETIKAGTVDGPGK